MHQNKKTNTYFHLITLSMLCLGLIACQKPSEEKQPVQKPDAVIDLIANDVAPVKQDYLTQYTPFTGEIQAINQTSIQAQTSATVLSVNYDIGQMVKQGQVLVELNNQDNAARLAQAKANLSAAKAQAALNRSLVERKQRLYQQGFISKLELEQSQVEYQAQQETIKAQQANVDIAQKAAQDTIIRSPITGYITKRQVNAGQSVSIGQTLFEIVDPKHIEIKASLPANEQDKLMLGQPVDFHIQGSQQQLQATVTRISPVADPVSRNIHFFARPADQSLSIGAFVEGTIAHRSAQQGQLIPLNSIQNLNSTPYVWVIRDNKIQQVNIQVLQFDRQQELALVNGLDNSDRVSLIKFNAQDQNRTVRIAP